MFCSKAATVWVAHHHNGVRERPGGSPAVQREDESVAVVRMMGRRVNDGKQ